MGWGGGVYIWGRVKRLYPMYLVSFIIAFILNCFSAHFSKWECVKSFISVLPELFMLQMGGWVSQYYVNNVAWYVSALLITSYIIHFLISNYKIFFIYIVVPFSILMIYSFYYRQGDGISKWNEISGFFQYNAIMRAFAGMNTGVLVNLLGRKRRYTNFGNASNIVISSLLFIIVIICSLYKSNSRYDYLYIFLLAIAIKLAFQVECKSNKYVLFLSNISYSIFLNHNIWRSFIFPKFFSTAEYHYWQLLLYLLCITLYSAVIQSITTKLTVFWGYCWRLVRKEYILIK